MVKTARQVLTDLCETIDGAGGVLLKDGVLSSRGGDWEDLGKVYLDACSVLGRVPLLEKNDEEEGEGKLWDDERGIWTSGPLTKALDPRELDAWLEQTKAHDPREEEVD